MKHTKRGLNRSRHFAITSPRECPTPNKVKYLTHAAAKEAKKRNKRSGKKLYTYRCNHCGAWHLTSSAKMNVYYDYE